VSKLLTDAQDWLDGKGRWTREREDEMVQGLVNTVTDARVMLEKLLTQWLRYRDFESDARALLARIDGEDREVFTHCTSCDIRCWAVHGAPCACGGKRVKHP
jgi:hypothetical protein